jgi:hypothetical protein
LKPEPPPPRLAAQIEKVSVAPLVSYRTFLRQVGKTKAFEERYLARLEQKNPNRPRADLKRLVEAALLIPGVVVYAEVTIEGFRRTVQTFQADLYDARTGAVTSPATRLTRVATSIGEQLTEFRPRAASDQGVGRFWLPVVRVGRYFVRLEVLDESSRVITFEDSRSFEVKSLNAPP